MEQSLRVQSTDSVREMETGVVQNQSAYLLVGRKQIIFDL